MKHQKPEDLILQFIEEYHNDHQRPPTVREIQEEMGYKSPRAVSYFLEKLEKADRIIRKSKSRGIFLNKKRPASVRLTKIPVLEELAPEGDLPSKDRFMSVDTTMFGFESKKERFALTVQGNAMQNASIMDGDTVIMEVRSPRPGDIVAAPVEGRVVVKRLIQKDSALFLQEECDNPGAEIPVQWNEIQGIMVGLVRKML